MSYWRDPSVTVAWVTASFITIASAALENWIWSFLVLIAPWPTHTRARRRSPSTGRRADASTISVVMISTSAMWCHKTRNRWTERTGYVRPHRQRIFSIRITRRSPRRLAQNVRSRNSSSPIERLGLYSRPADRDGRAYEISERRGSRARSGPNLTLYRSPRALSSVCLSVWWCVGL